MMKKKTTKNPAKRLASETKFDKIRMKESVLNKNATANWQ